MSLRGFVIVAVALLTLSELGVSLIAQSLSVAVVVHNRVPISGSILRDAQGIVNHIFAGAGIDLDWLYVHAKSRTVDYDEKKVHVLILPKNQSRHFRHTQDAVGFTPASGSSYGRLAYILEDRVMSVSRGYGFRPAVVLGAAIAHELGHILLSTGHTRDGVMRAELKQGDLRRVARGELGFTPAQAADIRRRLTGHSEDRTAAARITR
jgi:hypothetical protein